MAFDLTFTDAADYRLVAVDCEAIGTIVIGDFEEKFSAALCTLSKRDYLGQWLEAARRLQEGRSDSAIITSYCDHGGIFIGTWWPLYVLENGRVAVQNSLISREFVGSLFSVASCYDFIFPHRTTNEDGQNISEWSTTFGELAKFIVRVQGRLAECE